MPEEIDERSSKVFACFKINFVSEWLVRYLAASSDFQLRNLKNLSNQIW